MKRSLITQYEADHEGRIAQLTEATMTRLSSLAELPLQILVGFCGPVSRRVSPS